MQVDMHSLRSVKPVAVFVALLATMVGCYASDEGSGSATAPRKPRRYVAQVVNRYPHDSSAFTQGLTSAGQRLFESTGLIGESTLREVDIKTGVVLRLSQSPDDVFAEGLALIGDELYQLTWQEQRLLVWSVEQLSLHREGTYSGEGWGLCFNGTSLVMSDGSDVLQFRNPSTFKVEKRMRVTVSGEPLYRINELECTDNAIYANVWRSDFIVRIDALSGDVDATIDISELLTPDEKMSSGVPNGIAFLSGTQHLLVTGKYWPWLFEVSVEPVIE